MTNREAVKEKLEEIHFDVNELRKTDEEVLTWFELGEYNKAITDVLSIIDNHLKEE